MDENSVIDLPEMSAIDLAIEGLEQDSGAIYDPAILQAVATIRGNDPAEYARLIEKLKTSKKVRIGEFEKALDQLAKNSNSINSELFECVAPWDTPVDGAELLDEIVAMLSRYCIAERHTLEAAALWAVMTWLMDKVRTAPIANITAPEKRCGKSVMLTAIGNLSFRKLQTSNASTAVIFRAIDKYSPTLLIDEVDAFLNDNDEARGILNAGFDRAGAFVLRCEGDNHDLVRFSVWVAKALCGIGRIADTLEDRSIVLEMRRKLPGETVEPIRHSKDDEWHSLKQKICRFAADNGDMIAATRPASIPGLHDRANDVWEPLRQIAYIAGGDWTAKADTIALLLTGKVEDQPNIGQELLRDIRVIFAQRNIERVFSEDLATSLNTSMDLNWRTWNRGKGITSRQIAKYLSDYRISPSSIRIGGANRKGYRLEQFKETFARYLSRPVPIGPVTPPQPAENGLFDKVSNGTTLEDVTDGIDEKEQMSEGCDGVTRPTPISFY